MHVSYVIGYPSLQEYNGEQNLYILALSWGNRKCSEKDNQVTNNVKYSNRGYSRITRT